MYSQVGPQPLQLSEILAYMDEVYITDLDERETFLEIALSLDSAELNFISKARKK